MSGFTNIPNPPVPTTLPTAALLQSGPPIEPLKRVFVNDDQVWKSFVEEWLSTLKAKYLELQRASGGNDRGIDVPAFTDAKKLEGVWAAASDSRCFFCIPTNPEFALIGRTINGV